MRADSAVWMTRIAAGVTMVAALAAGPVLAAGAADGRPAGRDARALLVPRLETVLSAQVDGRLEQMTVQGGDRFTRGTLLFALDCRTHEANLRRAGADREGAERTLAVHERLHRVGSGNRQERDDAVTSAERARAVETLAALVVAGCRVEAPFDGRVVQRRAQPFQQVTPGQPVLEAIDDSVLEVEMLVPSFWLSWLRVGAGFQLRVDETSSSHEGVIARIAARVDPASQSLKVVGRLRQAAGDLRAGMSGSAHFLDGETAAAGATAGDQGIREAQAVARSVWTVTDEVAHVPWRLGR